jgi:ferrous-iron efflux pump FieF
VTSERGRLTRSAALASTGVAVTLLALKAWAAVTTGSVAMLASLADTGLDLLASLLTLFAVGLAARPSDERHRFGYGKAEAIAALMQTLLIIGSAMAIMARAVAALGQTELPRAAGVGIGVSLVAIMLTLGLVAWQRHVVRRTNSIAIATDSLHYQSDLLLNLTVIAALMLEFVLGLHGADAVFGIIIALWIGWRALHSARDAVAMLMDREWPAERRARLLEVVRSVPGVDGAHDLRTRSSGVIDFVQFHIWLPPDMPVITAHAIVDAVEVRVLEEFPGTEIFIHIDPVGHYDSRSQTLAELQESP